MSCARATCEHSSNFLQQKLCATDGHHEIPHVCLVGFLDKTDIRSCPCPDVFTSLFCSSFTVVPGKPVTLVSPADIRLTQATLNDVLVDQKRSCLTLRYMSVNADQESDDEEEDPEEEEEDKELARTEQTINVANLIPGIVSVLCATPLGNDVSNVSLTMLDYVVFHIVGRNSAPRRSHYYGR